MRLFDVAEKNKYRVNGVKVKVLPNICVISLNAEQGGMKDHQVTYLQGVIK